MSGERRQEKKQELRGQKEEGIEPGRGGCEEVRQGQDAQKAISIPGQERFS
jgi:hypothetical protein